MTATTTSTTPTALDHLPLPPGPKFPTVAQTLLFATRRHRLLPKLHRHYGPVFRLSVFPERHIVSIADPEHIRAVFSGPVTTFHAGEGNMILKPIMGEHSVLTTDEQEHRRVRKLLMPPFHGAALRGYQTMVSQLAEEEIHRWPIGAPFAAHPSMRRLTFEIILRVVFGVSDGPRLDELRQTLGDLIDIRAVDIFGWHNEKLQRFGRWKRNIAQRDRADELFYAEIADRRSAADLAARTDVLSRLLAVGQVDGDTLSDVELRDQLITLLLAGHETTATALAWALHELTRSPTTLARATRAADDGDDRYLEAVVKEAMRLRPVIYEVARRTTETIEIGGFRIPRGWTVMPAIGVVQADPAHHDDPELFRPERFLDGETSTSTWMPFGGGVRRCLGAGFSLMEATEVLRAVLTRYRISPDRPRPERVTAHNITFVPGRGARIICTPR